MIISFLIAVVGSACLAKTVSSAFPTIDITELPFSHDDMFARWCMRRTRWNLSRVFSHYLVQV
jgi:hypothetical protein